MLQKMSSSQCYIPENMTNNFGKRYKNFQTNRLTTGWNGKKNKNTNLIKQLTT